MAPPGDSCESCPVPNPDDDLRVYAAVASDLARGRDRAETLAEHGLDEEAFDRLEDRANEAMAARDEGGDDIPKAIVEFDAVLRATASKSSLDVPSLEDFVRALVIAQEGGKVHERLAERGLSIELLLRGSAYYTPRLAGDPELARRFTELCSRGVVKPKP